MVFTSNFGVRLFANNNRKSTSMKNMLFIFIFVRAHLETSFTFVLIFLHTFVLPIYMDMYSLEGFLPLECSNPTWYNRDIVELLIII